MSEMTRNRFGNIFALYTGVVIFVTTSLTVAITVFDFPWWAGWIILVAVLFVGNTKVVGYLHRETTLTAFRALQEEQKLGRMLPQQDKE